MSAQFVVLECGLQKYNLGAPSFDDYIDTMAKLKFYPSLVLEYHFHEDVLIQMDLLFVSERYLEENLS